MEEKNISLLDLFNIIDYWHDNRICLNVKIETKDDNILQGVASTGMRVPEYIKDVRPTIIYIDQYQEVVINNIKALEYGGCRYIINEEY
ncbi:MAG: hypothetical protein IJX65_06885 [Alistipes sp.]|nr:hypothetical protein [Alistipes sp.]